MGGQFWLTPKALIFSMQGGILKRDGLDLAAAQRFSLLLVGDPLQLGRHIASGSSALSAHVRATGTSNALL